MKTEPAMGELPLSNFISRLADINHLTPLGFDRFIFFPGMLFNSKEKWWGRGGCRAVSHEGVDLCFFAGDEDAKFRLDETVQIPMIYDGTVVHLMDDFLGKTVVTLHDVGAASYGPLLSLYGHVQPHDHLNVGDRIHQGEVFASIADPGGRSMFLPPHLHLSLAKPQMFPQVSQLSWEMLNHADRSVFIDPMKALEMDYSVIHYDNAFNLFQQYTRCSAGIAAKSK